MLAKSIYNCDESPRGYATVTSFWLDLFTAETWEEAKAVGFAVSGFSAKRRGFAKHINIGDILICYLGGGVKRFVGALEVTSQLYDDGTPIWSSDPFPVRFRVKPLVTLTPETAVRVTDIAPRLEMFTRLKNPRNWGWMFQGSPARLMPDDGATLLAILRDAAANPTVHPLEMPAARRRAPVGRRVTHGSSQGVTVPEPEDLGGLQDSLGHTEMQCLLLKLGADMGLDVWVARNDRNRVYAGHRFAETPRLKSSLPQQFDPVTNRIIELIDVLWLDGDAIQCAFEIEHTSPVYSGILRMSDLLAMQPNLNVRLYLVAPDERRQKVRDEVNRPTFARARRPLSSVCKFIPYSRLRAKIEQIGSTARYLRPEFIDEIAETVEGTPG
jgi:hypothetical protein